MVGLQYGDEGKAKVIDLIAKNYDIIARFNGGANAGHTIETARGRVALHQLPSGIFYERMHLYIGSGCVMNIAKLSKEIAAVEKLGVRLKGRLHISPHTAVVQPHHIFIDEQTGGEIGTTKNGIGPAYSERALRMEGSRLLSLRLADLVAQPAECFAAIEKNFAEAKKRFPNSAFDFKTAFAELKAALKKLAPYVEQDSLWLVKQLEKAAARVLFEGAQSCMLDVSKGTVPYVTSSNTVTGAAYVGGDVPPQFHRKTIGVAKAVMSRVGHGPFPSEFGGARSEKYCMEDGGNAHRREGEISQYKVAQLLSSKDPFDHGVALRILGNEYGTVTGRPRRVGMLDLLQLRHAVKMCGVSEIFITKCDMLEVFSRTSTKKIPLVTAYKTGSKKITHLPAATPEYQKVSPVVGLYPPLTVSITKARTKKQLPVHFRDLLTFIERFAECKVSAIGVGPRRQEYVPLL